MPSVREGLQQAFALVEAQRLRMNVVHLGHRRDHVRAFGFAFRCHRWTWGFRSKLNRKSTRSDLVKKCDARILIIEFCKFAHDFAAALVVQLRNDDSTVTI